MRSKNSAKGFSPIEIIIAVLVVASLGFGGWYLWQKNRETEPQKNTSNTQQQSSPEETVDPTDSWVSYSSAKGKFSFKYPPSWMLPSNMEQCPEDSAESSGVMVGPNEESAGKCQSGNSGQTSISSLAGDQRSATGPDDTSVSATIQGVQGVKRTSVATEAEGFHPYGTKFVTYEFYANGRTYTISYRQWPTETDQLAVFETIVTQTLRFSE